MNSQTVTVRKLLSASCDEVFDAWLDAEGMRAWMLPGSVTGCTVTLDPQVGGHFRIVMTSPEGEVVSHGKIVALERPSKLQLTWISTRWDNQETLLTIELRPVASHCELVLTHERFPARHSSNQLVSGWNEILEELEHHLAGSSGRQTHIDTN